jgi:hypothetical protein
MNRFSRITRDTAVMGDKAFIRGLRVTLPLLYVRLVWSATSRRGPIAPTALT